jgi:Predicted permeases
MKLYATLSGYLVKTFLKWVLITAAAVGSIFALFDFLELLRRTSAKPLVTLELVLKMFAYRFPSYFQDILPFVIFFAAILTLWRLNKNQEFLIIKASGVSIWQFLLPLSAIALVIGLSDLLIMNSFAAKLVARYYTLENRYIHERDNPVTVSEHGFWLRENVQDHHFILHAKHFDVSQAAFYNLELYNFSDRDEFIERFDAKIAKIEGSYIKLQEGWRIVRDGFPQKFNRIQLPTRLTLERIQESFSNPKTLTFYSLKSYAKLMDDSGLAAHKYFMQWHGLIARAFWLAVMVMLAATFTLRPLRSGGTAVMIACGITIAFILYFLRDITYALGNAGTLPPILAAWVPTIVTGLFAATKLLYSEDG